MEAQLGQKLDRRHLALYGTIEGNLISQEISRKEIVQGDTSRLEADAASVILEYKLGKRPLRTIHFFTGAYDNDPRALFDIPEMREWCQKLYKKVPYILLLLDAPTFDTFMTAVLEIEVHARGKGTVSFRFSDGELTKLAHELIAAAATLYPLIASSEDEIRQLKHDFNKRCEAVFPSNGLIPPSV